MRTLDLGDLPIRSLAWLVIRRLLMWTFLAHLLSLLNEEMAFCVVFSPRWLLWGPIGVVAKPLQKTDTSWLYLPDTANPIFWLFILLRKPLSEEEEGERRRRRKWWFFFFLRSKLYYGMKILNLSISHAELEIHQSITVTSFSINKCTNILESEVTYASRSWKEGSHWSGGGL